MSEPRRLLDEGGDLERSLLRSARGDGPRPGSRNRTLVGLGLAGGVAATVTTTTTATATTALVKSSATAALLKWIAAGVVGGLVTVGAVTVIQSSREPAPSRGAPVVARAPALQSDPRPVEPAAPALPVAAPPEEPAPIEQAAPSGTSGPAPVGTTGLARPAPTSLTEEVAALDGAREALASGDAARALRGLDEHDRRFPGGMLGPEATVLRIEALLLRGDRASAARLGGAFLDAHPRSPHASRLRSLLGLGLPPAGDATGAPAPSVTSGRASATSAAP
jgi:hypothetical protein